MGSGYVRDIRVETEFDGHKVVVVLKPIKRGDLFRLQAALPRAPDDPNKVLINSSAIEAFDLYGEMLAKKYVKEHNLVDDAGEALPVEEWAGSNYHTPLVTELMLQHMLRAVPENPSSSAAVQVGSTS